MIIVTEEINNGTSGARSPGSGGPGGTSPPVAAMEVAVTATIVATEAVRTTEEQDLSIEHVAMDSNGDGDGSESLLSQSPG